jgi:hypothetical protein
VRKIALYQTLKRNSGSGGAAGACIDEFDAPGLCKLPEESLRFLQVFGVEPFGKPVVYRHEQIPGCVAIIPLDHQLGQCNRAA